MESNREKVSYCIGLQAGGGIKQQFKDVDLDTVLRGFNDAFDGRNPELGREEINKILGALQKQVE